MEIAVKFTVIIPTRERPETLLYSLRTVVSQDYEDLTILVSDNFSQDNTKQVVDSFQDPRIRYINTGKRLSMAHNFEFALSHVKDGWVTLLGDDDGLLPGALTAVSEIIGKTGCQAVKASTCRYMWPGNPVESDNLRMPLNKGIEWRNSREWLGKLMKSEVSYIELPNLYTGSFIDSRIIDKARSAEGIFYHSSNPDTYSLIAFASVLDNYVRLKEPLAIGGISSRSGGSLQFGTIKNEAFAQKFFVEEKSVNIPCDDRLVHKDGWPKSPQVFIYESYLKTEHLHHDFLKIKMEDQVAIASFRVPKDEHNNFRKYCIEIADRNGVDMSIVDRKVKEQGRWERFRYWKYRIGRSFNELYLPGKEYGISDVYGASILAHAVLPFERHFLRRLKRLLSGGARFILKKISQVFKIRDG